jgi:hypothetical protein
MIYAQIHTSFDLKTIIILTFSHPHPMMLKLIPVHTTLAGLKKKEKKKRHQPTYLIQIDSEEKSVQNCLKHLLGMC